MKKCKNIECKNSVKENRIYCSLKCRNIYVNKHIRDYKIYSKTQKEKHKKKYIANKCLNCNREISYEKKRNKKFCSHSCSAKYNNTNRVLSKITKLKISETLKATSYRIYKNFRVLSVCANCNNSFEHIQAKTPKFCCIECKRNFDRKNLNEYQKYRLDAKFKFKLFDYPDEFDLNLVEKYGIYKAKNRGDNMNGLSRDHMYSIRDGFDNKINVELISHPANCRLIFQKENATKHRKSIITLEELIERIKFWNNKYEKKESTIM